MKITYLKLVNIGSLYTGTSAKEIEIDLSKSFNKIVMLTAANGRGKTTVLSCMHPFAYNGSLDDRSTESLILPSKNGYKEIHYQDGENEYVIKHFYTASGQSSHTVKSYIMKNGQELNTNGNVTSFKELISLEFDLDMDYLKLIRLGSNVINFIDMKPTERKNYMGNLLDEVDIYLQYHKKVINDMKLMKMIIGRDTDKLTKINITDIEEEEKQLARQEEDMVSLREDYARHNQEKMIMLHEINRRTPMPLMITEYNREKEKLHEIESQLKSKRFKLLSETDDPEQRQIDLIKYKSELEGYRVRRNMIINDLDNSRNELDDAIIQKNKMDNDEEKKSLMYIIDELQVEVNASEKLYDKFHPTYTSNDIEDLLCLLDKDQGYLTATYEVGEKPIKKVIKLMRLGSNIPNFINSKIESLYNNSMNSKTNDIMKFLRSNVPSISTPVKCTKDCPYKDMYTKLMDISSSEKDSDVEDEEFYSYMNIAYTNINAVINDFTSHSDLFQRMPLKIQNMFIWDTIYDKISKSQWIYDKEIINSELAVIVEYELFLEQKSKLEKAKSDLKGLFKSNGIDFIEKRITELYERIADDNENLSLVHSKISEYEEIISEIEHLTEIHKEQNELTIGQNETSSKMDALKEDILQVQSYGKNISKLDEIIQKQEYDIKRLEEDIKHRERRIDEYKILTKELKRVQEDYDDWELTRYTLAAKEGIPLVHINLHLKKTQKIVNDLLDIVYDGGLRINKFDVTPDAFKIPYTKNEMVIPDAHSASQGETSFITIATSFALSMQSITKYNIMLLDEIDSTLDQSNREKFIMIIEQMLDMINAEQLFLISHNNMFDMYPVDIIDLDERPRYKKPITVKYKY